MSFYIYLILHLPIYIRFGFLLEECGLFLSYLMSGGGGGVGGGLWAMWAWFRQTLRCRVTSLPKVCLSVFQTSRWVWSLSQTASSVAPRPKAPSRELKLARQNSQTWGHLPLPDRTILLFFFTTLQLLGLSSLTAASKIPTFPRGFRGLGMGGRNMPRFVNVVIFQILRWKVPFENAEPKICLGSKWSESIPEAL